MALFLLNWSPVQTTDGRALFVGISGAFLATRTFKERANFRTPVIVLGCFLGALLLSGIACHGSFPIGSHLLDTLLVVQFGVIWLANATHPFPERQMLWVNGDTMIFIFPSGTDVRPSTFLLLQIETSRVGKENERDNSASQAKPGNDQEASWHTNVVVQDSCCKCSKLATSS